MQSSSPAKFVEKNKRNYTDPMAFLQAIYIYYNLQDIYIHIYPTKFQGWQLTHHLSNNYSGGPWSSAGL